MHRLPNAPGSSVGIANGYGLDGPGIESRWGARFSALVQTGPAAHTASCPMGTGSLPVVKSGRGVMLTPRPLIVPWSRKVRAIPLLPLYAVRPVQSLCLYKGDLYLYVYRLPTSPHYRRGIFIVVWALEETVKSGSLGHESFSAQGQNTDIPCVNVVALSGDTESKFLADTSFL